MKKITLSMLTYTLPLIALAAEPSDLYFSKPSLKLSPQEKAAIEIAQKWQAERAISLKPTAGPEGSVRFVYGVQPINVLCAVLQICDIELQPGELVNNINLGDPRFLVEPAVSGLGSSEVHHLIIKPLDVDLETSLVVTTNRRTYHIRLRSHRTEFMPRVIFTYTEDAIAKWDAIKTRDAKEKQERTLPKTGEYLSNLNFAYEVIGSASWKPVRVYNDGIRTVIQMPSDMSQIEAPTLLVVRTDGSLFKDEETAMVNYRVQGDRFIVDAIFSKAILIAGVGKNQTRVTIAKKK